MPVVTNTWEALPQPDGRLNYVLRLYDQDGTEVRSIVGLLAAGINVQSFISGKIAETDEQLAEEEFRALLGL